MPAPRRLRANQKHGKAEAFVLDASVTLAWFFEDEANPYSTSVEDTLERAAVLVPTLWSLEVDNALLVGERRRRASEATVTQFARLLRALPIAIDEHTGTQALQDVLSLARTYNLSAYDAAYLELALRRRLPIATLDSKLRAAAEKAGVVLYKPR